MKIYDFKGFPNPARVRIALAEKGLTDQVEFVNVDVPGGAHRRAEFLAKNPSGTVPVLELKDGTCIAECTAITEYLDHSSGEPTLTGKSAKERVASASSRWPDPYPYRWRGPVPGIGRSRLLASSGG